MHPIDGSISKQFRCIHRIRNDQGDQFVETTTQDVLMQQAGKRAAALLNCPRVIIFFTPTLRTTAATGVDTDHADVLATELNDLSQRTKTSSQVATDFNKATTLRKKLHSFCLGITPFEPASDVRPPLPPATMKKSL